MMSKGAKVVVIGGSSGIGLATAQSLLNADAEVIVASRDADKLASAREVLGDVETICTDITDKDSIESLFVHVGPFDHLVISAAVVPGGRLADTPTSSVRDAFESRFWGSYSAVRAALPTLDSRGSVVLFSGLSATKPFVGESAGAASCGAVEALIRTLAVELGPLRINAVRPGVIDTPLLDRYFGESKSSVLDELGRTLPVRRAGAASDIADAVLFLLGNGFVTGSVLTVDGGHGLI